MIREEFEAWLALMGVPTDEDLKKIRETIEKKQTKSIGCIAAMRKARKSHVFEISRTEVKNETNTFQDRRGCPEAPGLDQGRA